MERGVARGHGIRVGLEDTTVLPDGRRPAGNGELVSVAAEMLGAWRCRLCQRPMSSGHTMLTALPVFRA